MSTTLSYGFGIALVGFLLNAVLYFTGFHSDTSRLDTANIIALVVNMVSLITLMVLGVRDERSKVPPEREFGYGSAFKSAFMIGLFAAIGGTIGYLVYVLAVNTNYAEFMVQAQAEKMRAANLPEEQIEGASNMVRKFNSPLIAGAFAFIAGLITNTLVALIVAVFTRRKDERR